MLPPEMQIAPVIVAGVSALLGLILWSAGIKVARTLMALFLGTALAGVGIWLLPQALGLNVISSGIIGLAIGVLIGAMAFRILQGLMLAGCLGVVACGAYYHVEGPKYYPKGTLSAQVRLADLQVPLKRLPATPPDGKIKLVASGPREAMSHALQNASTQWQAIPSQLRLHMLAAGILAALLSLVVAWLMPRYITWMVTAVGGAGLLVCGAQLLLHLYVPQYRVWVPGSREAQWGLAAALVLGGMLMQRMLFWPGRRAKHRGDDGDVATA